MRRPSSRREIFAAWQADIDAMARGEKVKGHSPSHDWDPAAGWYVTRYRKDGPPVPVRITVVREIDMATGELVDDERMVFEIAGERRRFLPIPLVYKPITESAYDQLMAERAADLRRQADFATFDYVAAGPPRP